MARRPAPPPKPKSPTLTVGQTRRRIERLQKCVASLEAFDPQKAHKRAPAVLELEAAIDKALSSAFGYGTPAYLRFNEAATLDPSPLLANVAIRTSGKAVGGPVRHEAKVQETRQQFSENKERAVALLHKAIRTLEEEISQAEPKLRAEKTKQTPAVIADAKPEPKSAAKPEVRPVAPRRWAGITFESVRGHVGRWLRRR
jgi:septum formation inhibitor MinC